MLNARTVSGGAGGGSFTIDTCFGSSISTSSLQWLMGMLGVLTFRIRSQQGPILMRARGGGVSSCVCVCVCTCVYVCVRACACVCVC